MGPVGSFELRDIEWTPAKGALIALSLISSGTHLALAATTGNHIFAVLALGLLAGFVVFFTSLWSPVLYLVGTIYIGVMTIVWILDGMPILYLGLVDKAAQAGLFALFVYLLFDDRPDVAESELDESA